VPQKNDRHSLIPGGAHTYSRGDDCFPPSAPGLLVKGSGAWTWDSKGRRYVDWAMAVRSVFIGHGVKSVDRSAFQNARRGVNLSRPHPEEFALAGRIADIFPGSEMVKFGKNGSDATAAAVRLARAATGRDVVLRSDQAQFLGVHDWFIGSTVMNEGVPPAVRALTDTFRYNDLEDIHSKLASLRGRVAAVILEPLASFEPSPNYLRELKQIVHDFGAILIFDEVVSGFRMNLGGYQTIADVRPDLTALGKALANGYPLSALVGRADIMELGGTRHERRRTFIMSSTYGPERSAIGAAHATLNWLERRDPYPSLGNRMSKFLKSVQEIFAEEHLDPNLNVSGMPISPTVTFRDADGAPSLGFKTLFMEAMVSRGILLGSHLFSPSIAHDPLKLALTLRAVRSSLTSISPLVLGKTDAEIREDFDGTVKPVFRELN